MMGEVYWDFLFNIDRLDYVLSFYCGGMNLVFLAWYHFEFREDLRSFQKTIHDMLREDFPIQFFEKRKDRKNS